MQTQIQCPRCQTPYVADVHQIVDVGEQPQLKQMMLAGYLNVAQCPNCSAVTQVTTPLLYHDPEHELFMVHVPMELSMAQHEQEQMIGQLVKRAMDQLPPEKRRGYMFQPQTVLSLQTMMEKVLETEGITPEMIARQNQQAELLQALSTADRDEAGEIIRQRGDEIDETFFAMLRASMDAAERMKQEDQALRLVNLQARLYRETAYGKRLERQQQAVRTLGREANQAGGLTPKLLLKHVLANRDDDLVVEALIGAGQQALNYDFFVLLSERIEKRQKAGKQVDDLMALRERLLEVQQSMERRSREIVEEAQSVLEDILSADDKAAAVQRNLGRIDDAFMYILSAYQDQARSAGDENSAAALQQVQELILNQIEQQAPPEVRLINDLMQAEQDEEVRQILTDNQAMVNQQLLEVVRALREQVDEAGDSDMQDRLSEIEAMIEARLAI